MPTKTVLLKLSMVKYQFFSFFNLLGIFVKHNKDVKRRQIAMTVSACLLSIFLRIFCGPRILSSAAEDHQRSNEHLIFKYMNTVMLMTWLQSN